MPRLGAGKTLENIASKISSYLESGRNHSLGALTTDTSELLEISNSEC